MTAAAQGATNAAAAAAATAVAAALPLPRCATTAAALVRARGGDGAAYLLRIADTHVVAHLLVLALGRVAVLAHDLLHLLHVLTLLLGHKAINRSDDGTADCARANSSESVERTPSAVRRWSSARACSAQSGQLATLQAPQSFCGVLGVRGRQAGRRRPQEAAERVPSHSRGSSLLFAASSGWNRATASTRRKSMSATSAACGSNKLVQKGPPRCVLAPRAAERREEACAGGVFVKQKAEVPFPKS